MLYCEARISESIKIISYDYSFIYFAHKVNKMILYSQLKNISKYIYNYIMVYMYLKLITSILMTIHAKCKQC